MNSLYRNTWLWYIFINVYSSCSLTLFSVFHHLFYMSVKRTIQYQLQIILVTADSIIISKFHLFYILCWLLTLNWSDLLIQTKWSFWKKIRGLISVLEHIYSKKKGGSLSSVLLLVLVIVLLHFDILYKIYLVTQLKHVKCELKKRLNILTQDSRYLTYIQDSVEWDSELNMVIQSFNLLNNYFLGFILNLWGSVTMKLYILYKELLRRRQSDVICQKCPHCTENCRYQWTHED